MNRYIVDSFSNGTIVYFIIRDTSNNSIVPLPTKYLKYKKNLCRKKKTLKNIALKLTWYLNYLEDNKLVTALYELAERHNNHSSNDLPLDELADKIAARLGGSISIASETSEAIPSSCVSSGPKTWDAPEPVTDNNIGDVMADILSF